MFDYDNIVEGVTEIDRKDIHTSRAKLVLMELVYVTV
jgi:hypothetical protein